MSQTVTDAEIQALAATAQPFSLVQLHWAPGRYQTGAEAIELEHQRRMVALRAGGEIAVLCPVVSGEIAGVAIMTQTPEDARATIAEDPCVRAGMMTFQVHPCLGFPGTACRPSDGDDPVTTRRRRGDDPGTANRQRSAAARCQARESGSSRSTPTTIAPSAVRAGTIRK